MHKFTKSTSKMFGQGYCQNFLKPTHFVPDIIMTTTTKAIKAARENLGP